jgi:general secretion pathway protein K
VTRIPTGASSSTACNAEPNPAPALPAPQNQSGFLLIAVIWVAVFLSLSVLTFTLVVRSHVQEASAESAAARAAALADAGVELAIADLVNAQWDRTWRRRFPPDLAARGCSIEGAHLVIRVSDDAGRVDLNVASPALLAALLAGLGASEETARTLADAIVDWRDADSTPRAGGAEAADYARAGRPAPRNAPFEAPEELARVIGMEATLLARLRPMVTVHSGLEGVDPGRAAPAVIAALSGRSAREPGPIIDTGSRRLPPAFAAPSPQRVFRVTAEARSTGATVVREAVVRVAAGRGAPYTVLAWARGEVVDAGTAADLGPC